MVQINKYLYLILSYRISIWNIIMYNVVHNYYSFTCEQNIIILNNE